MLSSVLDSEHIDSLLHAGVERSAVPGVVAVVVDREGICHEAAFGERELGSGVPMTVDTVGSIFSMTKALTAAAAMQLVERGQLSLDTAAGDVCSELVGRKVLTGFDGDGQPVLRPAASALTLRQLLTHTSGFGYELFNADLVRWHEVTGTPGLEAKGVGMLAAPLVADPGTRWEYGIDLDWVGVMIETVSGMKLGDYFAEHLTGPLAMTDTAYVPTSSMRERAASMHVRLPDGSLMAFPMPGPEPDVRHGGGAGLFGTMGDYGRFIRMILNDGELDGERVLATDTVGQMVTNQLGSLRVEPMVSAMPQLTNDAEFFPGQPKSWGMSFQINDDRVATGRAAGGLMWAGLANSYFWIDRSTGIGGAYLTQILPFVDHRSLELFTEFETAVYATR